MLLIYSKDITVSINFTCRFKDKKFVFCGHSLGGATASIVSLNAIEYLNCKNGPSNAEQVTAITFGAPLFADDETRIECEVNDRSKHLYHFVCPYDLVPALLANGLSLDQLIKDADMSETKKTAVSTLASSSVTLASSSVILSFCNCFFGLDEKM